MIYILSTNLYNLYISFAFIIFETYSQIAYVMYLNEYHMALVFGYLRTFG